MKEQLIQLLTQLPQVLSGNAGEITNLSKEFTIPKFHSPKKLFPEEYILDRINNQIITLLKSKGYASPEKVVDLPKVEGAELVVKTKEIFELNGGGNIKEFVEKLYQELSGANNPLIIFQLVGIFINIKVSDEYYSTIVSQIVNHEESYGSLTDSELKNVKVMLEYSSPNMAKSMTIGHFRNTIIGQIMYNIIQETGCQYLNRNYLGDRGTNFGKFIIILHYLYQEDPKIIDTIYQDPTYMMGVIYAKFKEIELEDKEDQARKVFSLLEENNAIIVGLWKIIRELTLEDFTHTYGLLGIKFDSNLGESFATTLGKDVLPDLEKYNILVASQGAQVVYMKRDNTHHTGWRPLTKGQTDEFEEGKDQVVIIQKSDDSSVYALRDLGLCKFRSQVMGIEYMLYVVGSEQSSYFQQVICLAEYMGYIKPQAMKHLGYGLYLQDGKKMSSRKGGVFRTIELIDEIADAITAQFENSNHEQAQKLAISALIINDTKGDISKDVNLDIPTITKMNGDTGVYIQYTAVRIRSLMQKLNEERITNFSNIKLKTESLSELQKKILFESSLLPLKIKISLELLKPHIITQYLLNLSALLNRWYNDSPKAVEMKDEERKQNLLRLHSVLIILEKTLNILHMPRVEKM